MYNVCNNKMNIFSLISKVIIKVCKLYNLKLINKYYYSNPQEFQRTR